MDRRPLAVAITGGIAAGKSEALAAFARHGAATLSADAVVHDLLAGDRDVRAAIHGRWGVDADDRARIGEIVFRNRAELDWLEPAAQGAPSDVRYDWVIGSDVLYERHLPGGLATSINC